MAQIDEEHSKTEKIDSRDLKIINILRENSREAYQQIAKKLLLSHDAVAYRIKRLEKLEIISKYTVDLNYRLLGYEEYILFLQLVEYRPHDLENLYSYIKKTKIFSQAVYYSGNKDLTIAIKPRDLEETDKILTEINNKFSKMIIAQDFVRKVKNLIKEDEVPKRIKLDIDEKDKKIINMLLENSRMSSVDIGFKLSLSPDAVIYRIKKLVELGIIRKFTLSVNVNKLGKHWYTALLIMNLFTKEEEEKLQDYASKNKDVIKIYRTIGEWNVLIDFLATDARDFHKFIKEIKLLLGTSLKDYDYSLAYNEIKDKFQIE